MTPTHMRREVDQIPEAAARLLSEGAEDFARAGEAIRRRDPAVVCSIARGSSDHAASYLKYATELVLGVPVASIGPSVVSLYGAKLKLEAAVAVAISQSGLSPDIVAALQGAREAGAVTLAITNSPASPLANAAAEAIDIRAGAEQSVAATKTFVSSIVAGLAVLAEWGGDAALKRALSGLPEQLRQAVACDWSELIAALHGHEQLYVLGRGPALAIASEAALKFKETCGMQAEAYSTAEVMHGPVAIVRPGFPVLVFAARDAAEESVVKAADDLAAQGARVFVTSDKARKAARLPLCALSHPITDALCRVASFYGLVEALARARGLDPDRPPRLRKVTETL